MTDGWHYAFVQRPDDECWDVYEVYPNILGKAARTAKPVYTLMGNNIQEVVSLLSYMTRDIQRGNYFSSESDMDSSYSIGD